MGTKGMVELPASTTSITGGDEYVVNGQKTWFCGAHASQYGILVVRIGRHGLKALPAAGPRSTRTISP